MSTLTATPLAVRMRQDTRAEHEAAEQSGYMQALLSGQLNEDGYRALVRQILFIYDALETALTEHQEHPHVKPFYDTRLLRSKALEVDAEFWLGPNWRDSLEASPATQAYVAHIQDVATQWPTGLIAHHYTRYLGDLSGGQVIAHFLRQHYNLQPRDGVEFYTFDAIPKKKIFKDDYREHLNGLDLDQEDEDRLIEKVREVFNLNKDLFDELAGQMEQWRRPVAVS